MQGGDLGKEGKQFVIQVSLLIILRKSIPVSCAVTTFFEMDMDSAPAKKRVFVKKKIVPKTAFGEKRAALTKF